MKTHRIVAAAIIALPIAANAAPRAASCARMRTGPIVDGQHKAAVVRLLARYLTGVNPEMAKRAAVTNVAVSRSFRQGDWAVYEVSSKTLGLDRAFLFANARMPTRVPYVWGGTAMPDERADITSDILSNNKGIDRALAACVIDTILGKSQ